MATRRKEKSNNTGAIYLVISLVILLFGVIFALQNDKGIGIRFFGFEYTGSLALILAVVFASGIIIGLLAMLGNSIRQSRVISHQNRDLDKLESENERLEKENAVLYKSEHNKRKRNEEDNKNTGESKSGSDPYTAL